MKFKLKCKWMSSSAVLIFLSMGVVGPSFALNTSLYTEEGFLGQENSLISSVRIRSTIPVKIALKPFVQLGSELSTLGNVNHNIDSGSSYLFYGPGISWSFFPLMAVFEWRQRAFYKGADSQNSRDLRTSLIYNSQWLLELNKRYSFYNEIYGEGVLTTADADNTILTAWVRLGIRDRQFAPIHLDLYLEPYGGTDLRGRFYNRRVEVRPTFRAQYFFERMYLALTGAYVFPISGKIQSSDSLTERTPGVRVLAILGGEI